jgi:hypothetical protein
MFWFGDSRHNGFNVMIQGSTADLMAHLPRGEGVCQGVVQAAEHHTSAGHRFQWGQSKALTYTSGTPVVS